MFDLPMASVHAFILTVYSVVAPDYNSAALRDGWSWICCGEQVHGGWFQSSVTSGNKNICFCLFHAEFGLR